MNRITHFEIHADDLPRAAKFYTDCFGWEIKKWDSPEMDYWMVMTQPSPHTTAGAAAPTAPGIDGGMIKRPCAVAPGTGSNAFVCTIEVDDYDTYAAKILTAGGREAMPKFEIAGMAWQGYFIDTEGNTFGLHQRIIKE